MAGILDGLRVIDLSWGTAGPITAMILADHGAKLTPHYRFDPADFSPVRS